MSEPAVVPLEHWGQTAKELFWPLFCLAGPIMSILDGVGAIDRERGFWLVVGLALTFAWVVSGLLWATAASRRRRATKDVSD